MFRKTGVLAAVVLWACLGPGMAQVADEFDEYGGLRGVRRAATGFFRTTRARGRWWLVDPGGFLFVSVGVNRVSLRPRISPEEKENPYRSAVLAKHGNRSEWARAAVERLRGWGFNTLGAGSDVITRGHEMAYTVSLQCSRALSLPEGRTFPDVFEPAYERAVRRHVVGVYRAEASERWLLGYFTDEELSWGPDEESPETLLVRFLGLDDDAPGRRALLRFLANRHLNIEELNQVWRTDYASFEEVGRTPQVGSRIPPEDVAAFQREVAEQYFRIAHDAIRAVDKYHLILGPRFHGEVPRPVLAAMGEYVDVVSLDYNGARTPTEHLREIHRVTERPVVISEFGFRVVERHDSALSREVEVATQEERAELYERFVRELMALPMVVGYHWSDYAEEPAREARGRSLGGFGLVDARDEPWAPLLEAAREVNRAVYRLAAGERPSPGEREPGEGG